MCILKFMFEYGVDSCIWSANEIAKKKFEAYSIDHNRLEISEELDLRMVELCKEYHYSLDWDDPGGPSTLTDEEWTCFKHRARQAYEDLVEELKGKYVVEYWV